MKKLFLIFIISLPCQLFAVSSGVELKEAHIDLTDKASLQRGAQLFTNYCLGCHQLQYQRYERTFNDLEIPLELGKENLIFGDAKVGEHMTNSMNIEDGANWFGAPPPDLTLEARLRGANWIYTYLTSFYYDETRPFKVNNLVFPDVGMPHVLQRLQGLPRLQEDHTLVTDGSGIMTDEAFDLAMQDLTNYLVYTAEPYLLESHSLGKKVIGFLLILLILVWLTKKEFWKDIKK